MKSGYVDTPAGGRVINKGAGGFTHTQLRLDTATFRYPRQNCLGEDR
ncbi:Uncharacterised protein [Mycobacteroides abscessus subsp. abscessus]|nr:Uncharacterised protein [Mycobacteroides abscessus subsp. abscessus]